MYPATAISGPEDPIEVSESTLAADHVSYHRTPAEENLVVTPVTFPRPAAKFPKSIWIGQARTIGSDRVEQTIYRSDDTKYEETWYDGSISAENWQAERLSHHRVDPGEEFTMQFGRGPLVPELRDWSVSEGTASAETYWYTDQSEPGFNVYHYDRFNLDPDHLNDLLVDVDGDRVIDFQTRSPGVGFGGVTADPGTTVTVTLRGNHMTNIGRATRTEAEYEVTFGDGPDAPPALRLVEVRGLDAHNRVPAGPLLVLVDVEDHGTGVDTLRAYAAETGTTGGTPFDDPAGWTPAETVYADGSRYAVRVDATGMDAGLDLAVRATDGAGDTVRSTTFEGVNTTAGADTVAPVEVRPDAIDPTSNGVVPVVVRPTDGLDPHRIDDDTLRFGAPGAVFDGGGAAPHNVQRLGHGALQAQFRANECGYDCDQDVAAGQLVADLDDGTAISGVDVIPTVDCGGQ